MAVPKHGTLCSISTSLREKTAREPSGEQVGRQTVGTKVIAYADDVTAFVTNPGELAAVQNAVLLFEKATEAKLNPRKSKALAVGPWSTPVTELHIDTYERVKILGYTFGKTIALSCNRHWAIVIAAVRAQVYIMYQRNLNIAQRVQFVNVYLFAKLWYAAQFRPPSGRHILIPTRLSCSLFTKRCRHSA
jgi:hypothetical protein